YQFRREQARATLCRHQPQACAPAARQPRGAAPTRAVKLDRHPANFRRTPNMAVYRLGERVPSIHPTAWVAPSADLTGLVELAENSSVWFTAASRGHNEPIVSGSKSNPQDGTVPAPEPG